MVSFEEYLYQVSTLRSYVVYRLKQASFVGKTRAWYNNLIDRYCFTSYTDYLYFKDPRCRLCGVIIISIKEVTCDHIIPRGVGGSNKKENKQIAHAHCNVLKSDRNIKQFEYVLKL